VKALRGALLLGMFGALAEAQPMPPTGRWAGVRPVARARMGAAVAERFAACLEAEGQRLDADDRALIVEATAGYGVAVVQGLDDVACGPDVAAEGACVTAIAALSCRALSRRLAAVGGEPTAAPPGWAEGYARGLADRVGQCRGAERGGGALSLADSEALTALRVALAHSLGRLARSGRCVVDENAVPACGSSLRTVSCASLAARVDGPLERFGLGVTPACGALLRCLDAAPR